MGAAAQATRARASALSKPSSRGASRRPNPCALGPWLRVGAFTEGTTGKRPATRTRRCGPRGDSARPPPFSARSETVGERVVEAAAVAGGAGFDRLVVAFAGHEPAHLADEASPAAGFAFGARVGGGRVCRGHGASFGRPCADGTRGPPESAVGRSILPPPAAASPSPLSRLEITSAFRVIRPVSGGGAAQFGGLREPLGDARRRTADPRLGRPRRFCLPFDAVGRISPASNIAWVRLLSTLVLRIEFPSLS
jgi:hypothetical protein